jgi:hypothetical protein
MKYDMNWTFLKILVVFAFLSENTEVIAQCDPLDITANGYSSLSWGEDGVFEACVGTEITLLATSVNDGEITWDLGVENGVPFIPETGHYYYNVTSSALEDCESDAIHVWIQHYPNPVITTSVDTVCPGGEVTIFSSSSVAWDQPFWLPGWDDIQSGVPFTMDYGLFTGTEWTETFTGYAWDPETYCESDVSVSIYVKTIPPNYIISDTIVCQGDSVTFTAQNQGEMIWEGLHNWDEGYNQWIPDGESFVPTRPGEYSIGLSGREANGCYSYLINPFNFTVLEAPIIELDSIQYFSALIDGSISVSISGGTPPYFFDWDNDGTGDFDDEKYLLNIDPGNYTIVVNDSEGCTARDTFKILSNVTPYDETIIDVQYYPNPSFDYIYINIDDDFTYELIANSGEIVRKGQRMNGDPISVIGLAQGSYLLRIRRVDRTGTFKIIKRYIVVVQKKKRLQHNVEGA